MSAAGKVSEHPEPAIPIILTAVVAAGAIAWPAGNRYGDPAGHACLAVSGAGERAITLRTGSGDRLANMQGCAGAALQLFLDALG